MKRYLKRVCDQTLALRLDSKGAVLIEGPKWCGKTTTAGRQAGSVVYLQDPKTKRQNMRLAQIAPSLLLGTGRISRMRMRPMSLMKSEDSSGAVSLRGLFEGDALPVVKADCDIGRVAFLCCRGGSFGSRHWVRSVKSKYSAALKSALAFSEASFLSRNENYARKGA